MSRMTTSRASFSWARPAMRRACSSEVSAVRFPAGSPESLEVPIEPEPLELLSHRRRDEILDRLALCYAPADLRRADRRRIEREQLDPRRKRERRREGESGPTDNAETGHRQHGLRLFPRGQGGELVGSDQEHRIVEAPVAEQIDGPRVVVELDVVLGKRELCEDKTR